MKEASGEWRTSNIIALFQNEVKPQQLQKNKFTSKDHTEIYNKHINANRNYV